MRETGIFNFRKKCFQLEKTQPSDNAERCRKAISRTKTVEQEYTYTFK